MVRGFLNGTTINRYLLYEFNFAWIGFNFIFFGKCCKFLIFCNFDRTDKRMSRITPIRIVTATGRKRPLNYIGVNFPLRNSYVIG